jgi:hypothetical protein
MSLALANSTIPTKAELESYQIIAKVAASNKHWRRLGGEGNDDTIVATILSVMLLARELGLPPMQAISGGINNIQGKFEISARIMNQLIRKFGHQLQVRILDSQVCKIWGKRKDTGEEMEVTYHIEEAARAGLIKDGGGWKKNPQDMLFARAISRLARRLYPDCIGGCYIEGELQESIQGKAVDGIEVPPLSEINIEVKQEPIVLALPDHVSLERVEKFLQESSSQNNVAIEKLKERANKNMDKFLEVYNAWETAQAPKVLEETEEELEELEI